MAKKPTTEEKIAHLKSLRDDPQSPAALAEFTQALKDRSNYLTARAAEMAGACALTSLVPQLRAAFERFLSNPVKTDPQCLAKTAIAEALGKLGYEDAEFFKKGMHYVQFEPVWGGEKDTAANLRGLCAFGLVQCSFGDALEVLNQLVDLLADPEKPARINAARAIAHYSRREGIPVLRLKIRTGDEDPEVVGECFGALLCLTGREAIDLVAQYLDSLDPDMRLEAATALGEMREPQAFEVLHSCWEKHDDPQFKKALLISMGLSRQQVAMDFLLRLIQDNSVETAANALIALGPCRFQPSIKVKAEAALREKDHPELRLVFKKVFGEVMAELQ
ncbi:MAG TPA: HEAT repeat domain-containing protein [Gemmataceae bacterium]|jgi:HEAT repeat protein|nr:HEAT repeat domain-containing protein [Gemmataceae bacterium]